MSIGERQQGITHNGLAAWRSTALHKCSIIVQRLIGGFLPNHCYVLGGLSAQNLI